MGMVRMSNQDNLYCADGFSLPEKNEGMRKIHCGTACPDMIFAVFDGMGGEKEGETAAWLASEEVRKWASRKAIPGNGHIRFPLRQLKEIVKCANDAIGKYRISMKYNAMGTTMAAVIIRKRDVITCNVGDSRIYRYSGGKLQQISEDHVLKSGLRRSAPLTQYLGIPEEELMIEPYIRRWKYNPQDWYLLCTDGVWGSGNDRIIEACISGGRDPEESLQGIFDMTEEYESTDNATAVLLELK